MPPRSPLPRRNGLDAAWVRTPDNLASSRDRWQTMGEFLRERLPEVAPVVEMLQAGEFVDQHGRAWHEQDPYRPNAFVWFHRPPAAEVPVPFDVPVLYADERIVVVDKPHFLATTPRGVHVRETVVVRLRESLGLPELAPAHRLDRLTAGVLVLTTRPQCRASYATLFQSGAVRKVYEAIAPYDPAVEFPCQVHNRIEKRRGSLQAEVVAGQPNAETTIELLETKGDLARYRLIPATGKTHQLRVHLAGLGLPIVGDPLYPVVQDSLGDDFARPLQLVARRLGFADPYEAVSREFISQASLDWPAS